MKEESLKKWVRSVLDEREKDRNNRGGRHFLLTERIRVHEERQKQEKNHRCGRIGDAKSRRAVKCTRRERERETAGARTTRRAERRAPEREREKQAVRRKWEMIHRPANEGESAGDDSENVVHTAWLDDKFDSLGGLLLHRVLRHACTIFSNRSLFGLLLISHFRHKCQTTVAVSPRPTCT